MGGEKEATRGKVNAVARRKVALVFLLLFLMVLLLSPWASAPMPSSPATGDSLPRQMTLDLSTDLFERDSLPSRQVDLQVAAALESSEFEALREQSEKRSYLFRDIRVSFVRIDPAAAYGAYVNASRVGLAADVMLMDNEWVKTFAVSGYLAPADSAFAGDAMSEQFEAVSSPLRWNGYIWGVPRDYDPYVVVWHADALQALTGDEQAAPPDSWEGWQALAALERLQEPPLHWLAIDAGDPFALLHWVQAATGEPADALLGDAQAWRDTAAGQAIALLDGERSGVAFARDSEEVASWLVAGRTAAAMLPYSQARGLTDGRSLHGSSLRMDLSAWKQPYVWPQGRSFTISSRAAEDDAARRWIAAMTDADVQRDNLQREGKLPVYRSLYRDIGERAIDEIALGDDAGAFPRMPLPAFGPDFPDRIADLRVLWEQFAAGTLHAQDWTEQSAAPPPSSDAELDR